MIAGRKESQRSGKRSLPALLLTGRVEVWDLSLVAVFQDTLPLRSGVTHLQLKVIDYPKDFSSVELQAETLWCCLGNRTPSDPGQKKVHFWNSPLYIGLLIGKIERQFQAENAVAGDFNYLLGIFFFLCSAGILQGFRSILWDSIRVVDIVFSKL